MTKNNADLYGFADRGVRRPRQAGRPQRHRPRPPHPARPGVPQRPARRRRPPGAGGRGLRRHPRRRHRHPPQRHRHRRPPRRPRPLCADKDPTHMTLLDDPDRHRAISTRPDAHHAPPGLDRQRPSRSRSRSTGTSRRSGWRIENEKVWPKVWQIACSVDHVAEPGDFYEYRAGWLSILIVRGHDGELRAFQNACRHRGNTICQGTGSGLDELRCPYHRWAWHTDGRLREVPYRKWFGTIDNDEYALDPAPRSTRGARSCGQPRHGRDAAHRVARGRARRPVVGRVRRLPLQQPGRARRCRPTGRSCPRASPRRTTSRASTPRCSATSTTSTPRSGCGTATASSYQDYGVPSPRLGRNVADQVVWDTWMQSHRLAPRAADRRADADARDPRGQDVAGRHRRADRRHSGRAAASTSRTTTPSRLTGADAVQLLPQRHRAGVVGHDQRAVDPARAHPRRVPVRDHELPPVAAGRAPLEAVHRRRAARRATDLGPRDGPGRRDHEDRAARPAPARPEAPRALRRGVPGHQPAPQPRRVVRRDGGRRSTSCSPARRSPTSSSASPAAPTGSTRS